VKGEITRPEAWSQPLLSSLCRSEENAVGSPNPSENVATHMEAGSFEVAVKNFYETVRLRLKVIDVPGSVKLAARSVF
jgi:hypothetical protein